MSKHNELGIQPLDLEEAVDEQIIRILSPYIIRVKKWHRPHAFKMIRCYDPRCYDCNADVTRDKIDDIY